jgi:hypothetical protein
VALYNGLRVNLVSGFIPFRREKIVDFPYLWKHPQTPKAPTIELPPATPSRDTWSHKGHYGGGGDGDDNNFVGGEISSHQFTKQWTGASVQAETSAGLAPVRHKWIENNTQLGVGELFTPPKIVLYADGLGSSQALQPPQARGEATAALGTARRRSCVLHGYVKR